MDITKVVANKIESQLNTEIQKLDTAVSKIQMIAADASKKLDEVAKTSNNLNSVVNTYKDALIAPAAINTHNRAQVALQLKSLEEQRVTQDTERKSRQILIDTANKQLINQSIEALKDKLANTIHKAPAPLPKNVDIQEVRKLRNGGIMLQFKTKEAAQWLKNSKIELIVLAEFNSTALIRDRTFQIMVPQVPTIFNLDDKNILREIEENNYISKDMIKKARWIKPIYRHALGQQFAHMILTLSSPEDANSLIRDGMYIMGAKTFPSKVKIKPKQCMKCRKWGHFAAECLNTNDSCSNCAEDHHTSECPNPQNLFCISCKNNSHASWDRNCLEYHKKAAQIDKNIPENQLKFFPTDENWTLRPLPVNHTYAFKLSAKYTIASLPPPPPATGPRAPATRTINMTKQRKAQTQLANDQATLDNFISIPRAASMDALPLATADKAYNLHPRARPKFLGKKQASLGMSEVESEDETLEQLESNFDSE